MRITKTKKSSIKISLIIVILLFMLFPIPSINAAWLGGWDQRVKIIIDKNDIDSGLSNFPVLIYISSNSGRGNDDLTFVFDELQNDANRKKIAITEDDGITECYVEIEKWDDATEKAWLWVKIPTITSGADTEIYLYFDIDHADNANVGDCADGSVPTEAVWSNGFVAVYHMRDATTSTILDSTSSDLDGTKTGANQPQEILGQIGPAQEFDPNENIVLNAFGGPYTAVTMESWFQADDTDAKSQIFLLTQVGGAIDRVTHGIGSDILYNYFRTDGVTVNPGIAWTDEVNWHYFATTRLGTAIKGYPDGTQDAGLNGVVGVGTITSLTDCRIGSLLGVQNWFDGTIDELRFSSTERGDSWIGATYETGIDDLLDFENIEYLISPPSDPNLLFGAGFNSSSPYVELHWNHSLEDVQFFEVQNSSDKISWDYLGQTSTANYTDFQVINGTERYYRIRACNQTDGDWYNSSFTDINFETVYFIPEMRARAGWLEGWDLRVKITIDHDDIDAGLTDFPVLIYISDSSGINNEDITFIFDEVGANSLKIAVTEDDGTTECYVEVEKWDLGNEQAWLWTKIPSILYDVDTDIYLYYDNDHADNNAYVGLTNSVVAENVWDNNFLMVQHQSGSSSPILDSTSNDIDMTETGDPTYQQTGPIDGEIDYDGNDYHLSAVDVFDAIVGTDKGTIGLWIKTTASDATSRVVFSIEGAYVFNFKYGEGGLLKTFWSGTHTDSARTTTQINTGAQFYVVSTYDGTNQRVYVNSVLEATDACNLYNITALTRASGIAASWNGGNPIDANIDDVRVSKIDRSPSWIEASYETGRDDLLDWGLEEISIVYVNVTGAWVYYNLTTINVTVGVHDAGDVNSTLDIDGDTYNCSEVVGVPGYVIEFEWTDVDQDAHCLWVTTYIFYDGVSAHTINVDLWNFTSTAWVTIGIIYDMVDFEWVNSSIYDLRMPNDFINSTGAVRGRFYHSSAGNINDDIHNDFLKLYAFIPFEDEAVTVVTVESFFWIPIAIVLSIIAGLLVWLQYEHN